VADNINYTTTIDGATLSYNHLTGVLNYQETYQSANSCDILNVYLGGPTLYRVTYMYDPNRTAICSQNTSITNYQKDMNLDLRYDDLLNFATFFSIVNVPE